jgi:cell division protease FtsH
MGIASTVSILPTDLVAAADFTIKIPPPSSAVIGAAVGRFLGKQTETPKDLAIAGIDFYGLLSAFRANSSAKDIFARLGITSATPQMRPYEDLPDLDTAVEYGAARTWALELASDFEFYKAGALQWSEIQGQASAVIHGPPGLGKTFFAKLLAKKLGVVLIAASIPDLFAKSAGYLDSVIKASQEVFDKAAATSGCVLFWDELEALPRRDSLDGRSASWWNSVVAHFLLMISEIQRPGTFLLAATNYIEKIDPALLRPGRFGKTIEIKRPDADGVVSILRHHLRGELIDTDLSELGQLAENATGAELSQMVQTARRTARYAKRPLGVADLVSAIFPHEALNEPVLRRVSLHEAGHVVVSLSEKTDKILRVAIGGMAGAFGQTTFKREATLETRAYIEARVTNVLAGRAAEIAILGECCSGGGGDIDSDLGMATSLVASLHFSDGLAGTITYLTTREQAIELLKRDPSLRTTVERDLQRLQARAIEIVKRHRAAVEAIAAALATRRHLSGPEAEEIFKNANAGHPLKDTIQEEKPKC